ncbi:hypothetical protein [Massilia niabensis]|uniref:Uncharacterized protein n=1 Tax=Massilia niabensis TaxID=544910 RepID=A0ABW0L3C5_9BURK
MFVNLSNDVLMSREASEFAHAASAYGVTFELSEALSGYRDQAAIPKPDSAMRWHTWLTIPSAELTSSCPGIAPDSYRLFEHSASQRRDAIIVQPAVRFLTTEFEPSCFCSSW